MTIDTLDDLNMHVTDAIIRAEHAPAGSADAENAYREVSELEEQIAARVPVDELEGGLARVGAVSAALRAGDWLRAARLAELYAAGAPDDVVEQLREFAGEAETVAQRADEAQVRPIEFELRAA